LGVVDGERVAVTKGLAAGDIVVTEGADRLRDGAQVLLPNSNPSAAPQRPAGQPGAGSGRRKRQNGQAPNGQAPNQPGQAPNPPGQPPNPPAGRPPQ
jgi:multidrug efflux system membrane fusion protein